MRLYRYKAGSLRLLCTVFLYMITGISGVVHAQTIELQANEWKLVSFYELPENQPGSQHGNGNSIPNLLGQAIQQDLITDIWAYQPAGKLDQRGQWQYWIKEQAGQNPVHPDVPGIPGNDQTASDITNTLNVIDYGRAYWIRGRQSGSIEITVSEDNLKPYSAVTVAGGWNLIGFPITRPVTYDFAFAGVEYSQIWRYNSQQNRFESIERAGGASVTSEDFNQLEPGVGYWVLADKQDTLAPVLRTILPGDLDDAPFVTVPAGHQYGDPISSWNKTNGDVDFDQCGDFDSPESQRTLSFGDFAETQPLAIGNTGAGVLAWEAKVVSCTAEFFECSGTVKNTSDYDWLSFRERITDEDTGREGFAFRDSISGTNTQIDTSLVLHAERDGLIADETYQSCIEITHNSVENPEPRRLVVEMTVPDLVGDYEINVVLDRVIYDNEVKSVDQHNPVYFMSLLRDGSTFKGLLDDQRSMLITELTYLNGFDLRNPEANFQLFGKLDVPARPTNAANDEYYNPYDQNIVREFTFIGRRGGEEGSFSAKDLTGEYFENVYGMAGDKAIRLEGHFTARRLSDRPQVKDSAGIQIQEDKVIEKGDNYFTLDIQKRISVTDLQLILDIAGLDPEKVQVALIAPWQDRDAGGVLVHDQSSLFLNGITFPVDRDPADSFESFREGVSSGTWTLYIRNRDAVNGRLNDWQINIEGANRYQTEIIVPAEFAGLNLTLTGCGMNLQASAELNEDQSAAAVIFDGLIPCDYELSVNTLGYERSLGTQVIEDCRTLNTKEGNNPDVDYCQLLNSYTYQTTFTSDNFVRKVGDGLIKVLVSPLLIQEVAGEDVNLAVNLQNIDYISGDASFWKVYKHTYNNGQLVRTEISSDLYNGNHSVSIPAETENRPGTYTVAYTDAEGRYVAVSDEIRIINRELIFENDDTLKPLHIQFSTHASGGHFMDSATFDIDRPDHAVNDSDYVLSEGLNDSDCFRGELPELEETGIFNPYTNKPRTDTSLTGCVASSARNANVVPGKVIDAPVKEDDQPSYHFRMSVSVGQPFVGGSSYGSLYAPDQEVLEATGMTTTSRQNFRMDTGIQSQPTDLQ